MKARLVRLLDAIVLIGVLVIVLPAFAWASVNETEPNETFDAANYVEYGEKIYGSNNRKDNKTADVDYYKVTIPDDGKYHLLIKNEKYCNQSGARGFQVDIYDRDYVGCVSAKYINTNNTKLSKHTVTLKKGTTYIKVKTCYSSIPDGHPYSVRIIAPLDDVDEETPHYEDILWCANHGISNGWDKKTGTKEFRPYEEVRRADMAAFLFRLARNWGLVSDTWQPVSYSGVFTDVDKDTPHAREIMWLASKGISNGWDAGGNRKEFRPYSTVKRQDMAAFLFRLAKCAEKGQASETWQAQTSSKTKFSDVSPIDANNHHNEVWWMAETGVSVGWDVGDGRFEFRGLDDVKRCDMAAFLYRMDRL